MPDQDARQQRVGGRLAADADRLAGLAPGLGRHRDQLQHGRLPGVGEVGQVGGQPVGGHRVLRQVVGADRQEVDVLEQPVGEQRRAGHLDHHAGASPRARTCRRTRPPRRPSRPSAPSPRARCRSPRRPRAIASSWRSSRPGLSKDDPQPADAEGRVLLVVGREGQRLVRAGVEGAEHDVAPAERPSSTSRVDLGLLLDRRLLVRGRGRTARCGTARHPRPARRSRPAADSPSATLASTLTASPSGVAPGPVQAASAAARRGVGVDPRAAASSGSGSISTVPAAPSTSTARPAATSSRPRRRRRRGGRAGGR